MGCWHLLFVLYLIVGISFQSQQSESDKADGGKPKSDSDKDDDKEEDFFHDAFEEFPKKKVHFSSEVGEEPQGRRQSDRSVEVSGEEPEVRIMNQRLPWTRTFFMNMIYKTDETFEQNVNVVLSPIALELIMAGHLATYADKYYVKTFILEFLIDKNTVHASHNLKPNRWLMKEHYAGILRNLTAMNTVFLQLKLYAAKPLKKDSQPAKMLEDFRIEMDESQITQNGGNDDPGPKPKNILFSTLTFKGKWKIQFVAESENRTFNEKSLNFMKTTGDYFYKADTNFKVVGLPFQQDDLSLLIFLPNDNNGLQDLENEMGNKDWLRDLALKEPPNKSVQVIIPKFSLYREQNYHQILLQACKFREDFEGLHRLYIGGILQFEAFSIDEAGAKTPDSGMRGGDSIWAKIKSTSQGLLDRIADVADNAGLIELPKTADQNTVDFLADHPFVFALVHTKTNIILLQGHYVGPEEG